MATLELLHGAWHEPSCWDLLIPELQSRGHDVIAPLLPLDDPAAGYSERARPAVDALADITGPVAVVGHSMSSALAPLVANEREVALVVHLCPRLGGLAEPPGAPQTFRAGVPFPESGADGRTVWEPDVAIASLYGRLPEDMAHKLAERRIPMAMPPGDYPLPRHPDVPTVLIYAAEDEIFEPEWERFMARELLEIEPIEIPGGHFPMIEDPAGLAELLDSLVS
jgi:pimeloyl-ACP methyl ester carboxylesterase